MKPKDFLFAQEMNMEEKENIKIYVPKGAPNNYKIVIDDKGEDILNGEPGNLIVKINIIDHETFKRKGNDLFIDYNISLIESLFINGKIFPCFSLI